MVGHGPQPGSMEALWESSDPEERRRGDAASQRLFRLVTLQLAGLTLAICILSFVPSARHWAEEMEHDVCMEGTHVMTCLDWGLNAVLFFVLLPTALLTVHISRPSFRWGLWIVWSLCLILDLALFVAAFSWRKYAAASCIVMVGFVLVMAALAHLPTTVLSLTWAQAYSWAIKVGLFVGVILIIITQDTSYAWVALAGSACILYVVYCLQLIASSCPDDQAVLGSMFVLFPEALPVALAMLKRRAAQARAGPPTEVPLVPDIEAVRPLSGSN